MANNAHLSKEHIDLVLQGKTIADVSRLVFRDPDHFCAGELHNHKPQWHELLNDLNDKRFLKVRDWIDNSVNVTKFFKLFRGSYKGKNYKSSIPPSRMFANHLSCRPFSPFISNTVIERLRSWAISLWGRVGECTPPYLVLSLTVEPLKPRLCNDNRYLNLWIKDKPFSLDSLRHLPKYVENNHYQNISDDKSGYDHILLHPSSRTFFGFEWGAGILLITLSLLDGKRQLTYTKQ